MSLLLFFPQGQSEEGEKSVEMKQKVLWSFWMVLIIRPKRINSYLVQVCVCYRTLLMPSENKSRWTLINMRMCTEKQLVALQPCLLPSRTSDLPPNGQKVWQIQCNWDSFSLSWKRKAFIYICHSYILFFSGKPKHLVNDYSKLL